MNRRNDAARRERGFALVSVLWAISILSLIAAAMASSSNFSYSLQRNELRRVQAEMLAETALNLAVLGLLDPRLEKRWRVDGVQREIVLSGIRVKVAIQDASGLIDLNDADLSLFQSLLVSAGIAPQ